jgi:predicted tellurium resistance membrane protein TerC
VVAYHQNLPGRLHPQILFAGVVLALVMRFEFVGGFLAKVFRAAEFGVVFFLGFQFWDALII